MPDIMAFFAERADRAQGLEGVIAALRDANEQLCTRLAEKEAEARTQRVRRVCLASSPLPPAWIADWNSLHVEIRRVTLAAEQGSGRA